MDNYPRGENLKPIRWKSAQHHIHEERQIEKASHL